jgi:hypothetical protein
MRPQLVHARIAPARVHDADAAQVEPQGQGLEPVDDLGVERRALDLRQEGLVLPPVAGTIVPAEALAGVIGIARGPRDGVELVVAQIALAAPVSVIARTSLTVATCCGPRSMKSPTNTAVRSGCRQARIVSW